MQKNSLISLFLTMVNVNWGLSFMNYYYFKRRQRIWEFPLIAVSIALLVIIFISGIWMLTDYLYEQLLPIGQQNTILTLAILCAQLIVAILGMIFIVSTFYFSDDLKIVIPLPYRAYQVVAAKFGVVLLNEYITLLVFIGPVLTLYGIRESMGFSYILIAIGAFLLLPLLPLVIASIFVFFLMRVVNLSAKKEFFTMMGGILVILFVVLIQYFAQAQPPTENVEEYIYTVLLGEDGLATLVGERFPPSLWGTRALARAGTVDSLHNFIFLLIISGIGLVAMIALGEYIFYRSAIMGLEADKGKKKSRKVQYRVYSPIISVAINEWKLFSRRAVFVLNGLTGIVLFPILLALPLITGGDALEFINIAFEEEFMSFIAFFIALVYPVVQSFFTVIPSTTFSREGRLMSIKRNLPLPFSTVFLGKLLSIQLLIIIGSIPGIVILNFLLPGVPIYFGFGFIAGCFASTAFSSGLMLLDLKRPMLDWNNPQQAMKSNLNAIIGMIGGATILVVAGYLIKTLEELGVGNILLMTGSGILSIAACFLLISLHRKFESLWWQRDL